MKPVFFKHAAHIGMACAAALMAGTAQADLITFESLAPGAQQAIANGYHGFTWNPRASQNIFDRYATRPATVNKPFGTENSGFHNGVVSGDTVAYSSAGFFEFTRAEAFTLNSLFVTSAYWDDRTLRITGSGDGVSYLQDVVIGVSAPTQLLLDWTGVTAVQLTWLSPNDGTRAFVDPALPNAFAGNQIVIDDIRYNESVAAVPLPSVMWLMAPGLLGLGAAARRRPKAV